MIMILSSSCISEWMFQATGKTFCINGIKKDNAVPSSKIGNTFYVFYMHIFAY